MSQRQWYVEEALAAYQIAGQFRLLGMRTGFIEYAELSKLYIERAWRFERYANEFKPEVESPIVEEKETMKPISRLLSLLLILVLVLSMGSAAAQESTAEIPTQEVATAVPTAEVTPEPPPIGTPVIVDQGGFRVGIAGFIFFVATLFLSGAGVGVVWQNTRNSKQAKDNLELAYESTSPKTQEDIRKGYEVAERAWNRVDQLAREVLNFFEEVTDKEENVDTPPAPTLPPAVAESIRRSGITPDVFTDELRG